MPTRTLPPHITSEHTAWPLGHMEHVGAYKGWHGWEVLHIGPGFQVSYGIYTGDNGQEAAEDVAEALYLAWDTVRNIPASQMRALLEFFTPRPALEKTA